MKGFPMNDKIRELYVLKLMYAEYRQSGLSMKRFISRHKSRINEGINLEIWQGRGMAIGL